MNSVVGTSERGESKSMFARLKDKIIVLSLSLMAIGNWSDTKSMIQEAYVVVVSNFTNVYEYESLAKVNVGSNIDYIYSIFGAPQLIKPSKYDDAVTINYYLDKKYILALLIEDKRVVGYSITGLKADFHPYSLLDKQPIQSPTRLVDRLENLNEFSIDHFNVKYFVLFEDLGKRYLFNQMAYGFVDYQGMKLDESLLVDAYTQANSPEPEDSIASTLSKLVSNETANYVAITEKAMPLLVDSILTQYEYQFYY